MSKYETVNFPIKVPKGKYCWKSKEGLVCDHYDNEGGYSTCDLGFRGQEDCTVTGNVLKAKKCSILK